MAIAPNHNVKSAETPLLRPPVDDGAGKKHKTGARSQGGPPFGGPLGERRTQAGSVEEQRDRRRLPTGKHEPVELT